MRTKPMIRIFIGTLTILLAGCSLEIEIEDRVADPNAIVDIISARRALSTAYENYTAWQTMTFLSAMSDDVTPTPTLPKSIEMFNSYHLRHSQLIELAGNIWDGEYKTIMFCNALLERASQIQTGNDEELKQLDLLSCEANALKAFCYFRIMCLFAPRYSSTDAGKLPGVVYRSRVVLENPQRISLSATADSIRMLALPYMEKNAPAEVSNYRISPLAARCLLADVELWAGNYGKVIELTRPVINSFDKSLFTRSTYEDLWNQSNAQCKETLFNIDYTPFLGVSFFDNWNHSDGDFLVINSSISYAETDLRKKASLIPYDFPINHGESYRPVFLLGKYNAIRRKNLNFRYISSYRMADFVFLCAEAMARTGQASKAVEIMNLYLERRETTLITPQEAQDKNKLVKRILEEKQKEFLCEGRRFFDMKRTNADLPRNIQFDQSASPLPSTDFRWTLPIPESEYRYNKNAKQNIGWEDIMPKPQH